MTHLRWALACAAFLGVGASAPLFAQKDPRLLAAVAQAQQGQGDSARAAVAAILNATPATDPLYAEALYTQGRIAASTGDMQKAMLRVAVEFADSPWADNALLQLAELSYANGDLAGTERNLERLRSDYPTTDVMAPASLWAARAYFAQGNTAAGCGWLKSGIPAAGTNIELLNQLQFLNGRCQVADTTAQRRDTTVAPTPAPAPVPAPDTAKKPAPAPAPVTPAPPPTTWSVQVAALKAESQATTVMQMLARDGFPPHLVKDADGTFKVRAGKFATKAEATAYARKMRRKYGQVFVVEERP
ncbi:MAG TPA: SPOR domain-containing protein [Gemmatimonadales bacterium]|nr:SPOR domain-containing protein [Gemmatimonadales bacterium]